MVKEIALSESKEMYRPILIERLKDHPFALEFDLNDDQVIIKNALNNIVKHNKYPGQALALSIWDRIKSLKLDIEILDHGDSFEKKLLIDLYLQRFAVYGFLKGENIEVYLDTILVIVCDLKDISFEESVNVVIYKDIQEWCDEINQNILGARLSDKRIDDVNEIAKKHFTEVIYKVR